jgi:SAM-dependent methyltransferase
MSHASFEPRRFSHVANFTGYMRIAAEWFAAQPEKLRVLDLPAGNGLLANAIRNMGHEVVCGDINREREDYHYVDMSRPLPFTADAFDAVLCLEGVEHLVNPVAYIAELSRITRPGGHIVLSTPNVMNFWSRLHFLFTGAYYQFNPAAVPELKPNEVADRGHVFPLSYFQLRYLFGEMGVDVAQVIGDKYKRKLLFPLYFLLLPGVWLATRAMLLQGGDRRAQSRNHELAAHALSMPLLFSRSLVLVLKKR